MKRFSALVAGAGPAGTSAALGLLRAGGDVTVLEQNDRWQGRVCGAFLSPEAVAHLDWLGLLPQMREAGAVEIHLLSLSLPSGRSMQTRLGLGGIKPLGIPRETLESVLSEAVEQRGGRIRRGVRVLSHGWDGKEFTVQTRTKSGENREASADMLVLADGRFSQGGMPGKRLSRGWFGWNAGFSGVSQKPGQVSLHFYPGGYVGTLTFADGTTNVSGLHRQDGSPRLDWERLLSGILNRHKALAAVMAGAKRQTPFRGVGPLPFGRRAISSPMTDPHGSPQAVLAGDAQGVGDPFMGEGIGRALGAGPWLHRMKAQELSSRQSDKFWERRYRPRFLAGAVLRQALSGRVRLAAAFGFLKLSPKILESLLPIFHEGFNQRHREAACTP